jgi:hypothetical protein
MNDAERDAEVRRLAAEMFEEMQAAGAETVGDLSEQSVLNYRARLAELGFDPDHLRVEPVE